MFRVACKLAGKRQLLGDFWQLTAEALKSDFDANCLLNLGLLFESLAFVLKTKIGLLFASVGDDVTFEKSSNSMEKFGACLHAVGVRLVVDKALNPRPVCSIVRVCCE